MTPEIPSSVEEAIACAAQATKDGLRGMYPVACGILAREVLRLEAHLDECRKLRNDLIAQIRNMP